MLERVGKRYGLNFPGSIHMYVPVIWTQLPGKHTKFWYLYSAGILTQLPWEHTKCAYLYSDSTSVEAYKMRIPVFSWYIVSTSLEEYKMCIPVIDWERLIVETVYIPQGIAAGEGLKEGRGRGRLET